MFEDKQKQYIDSLLKDLALDQLPKEEQNKAVQMISERFQNVIIYTMIELLNNEQKKEFAQALKLKGQAAEDKIVEIAALIPDFQNLLHTALSQEYEALKFGMNK